MLYGNIIFIKKTGGDGSKYPVTEKNIKIGRSEECLIRIYNNQVALEHCQLIIGENGQATLKDLSNQTILNGNLLAQEDVTLCHGDVFKVGERLARWEYLPTSKYYRQLLSPTGRLVAVVMPQQRSQEDQSTPGTSASFVSLLKNTSVGGKKRYSERFASENTSSAAKMRKSSGFDLIQKGKADVSKFVNGRPSLKTKKLLLPVTKIKERRSTLGIVNSKSPKGKCRKSTLPSWKVNVLSPPTTKSTTGSYLSRKSANLSRTVVKSSLKDNTDPGSENLSSDVKSEARMPQKNAATSEEIVKSVSKNVLKTPLKITADSPFKSSGSAGSTQIFSKSPSPKKPSLTSTPSLKPIRLIHSEKKLNSSLRKSSVLSKELRRPSLAATRRDETKRNLNKGSLESFARDDIRSPGCDIVMHSPLKSKEIPVEGEESPLKVKTPEKVDKTAGKRSVKKSLNNYGDKVKTPRGTVTKKALEELAREKLKTPATVNIVVRTLKELDDVLGSKKEKQTVSLKDKSSTVKKTPQKLGKSVGKSSTCKVISSASRSRDGTLNSSGTSSTPLRRSKSPQRRISSRDATNFSKEMISTPRGVRRKLSPSISSAEKAAKKLKTSSPKKPDKNKKAALLVLGKASRKQLLTQNVKVLLKQKIVKKAIKQSAAASTLNNDSGKKDSVSNVKSKPKKGLRKRTSKPKLKAKKKGSAEADSSKAEEFLENKEKIEYTLKGENLEENVLSSSKTVETAGPPRSPLKAKNLFNEAPGKSSNQFKKSESPRSISSKNTSKETSSPNGSFEMSAENFLFNSNRRCSKRLSSRNDTGRPDFVELSPTALGLIPKNMEIIKSIKQSKRRSSSLVTPKNIQATGIIKSASTSKIGNRKSVRFSSKDMSINSEFCSPDPSERTDFYFGAFQTPNVSVDVFISPLGEKSSASKKDLSESSRITFDAEEYSGLTVANCKSASEPRKCVRKLLQSPQPSKKVSSSEKEPPRSRSSTTESTKVHKQSTNSEIKDSERKLRNNLSDVKRVLRLQASPKNDLSDVRGVKKLLATPKAQRSPRNDLSDVRGVKKLLATPKAQKSPRNDLSDVRGVKKLLATPKAQKSPRNDLSDVRGVKKLLTTPKAQKSPRNDLSDVRGVKKLLTTPKAQKSPRNDLSDVRGVKKLLATPKAQKSPRNDLSDVRGVKKLLATPKAQKSPRNDLSDVRGVKKLLATPKAQKSPRNDLSDVRGVKKLLATPKAQKSPRNNLTDIAGVKELLGSPRIQKSPKNELLDLSGVQQLLGSPKPQGSPKSDSTGLTGGKTENHLDIKMENFADSTAIEEKNRNSEGLKGFCESPQSDGVMAGDLSNVAGRKQLLISKSSGSVPKSKKTRQSQTRDFRAIRGQHTIHSNSKDPKNDLSDLTGVRELFSRHSPKKEFNISLTGVPQLFDVPEAEVVVKPNPKKSSKKSTVGVAQKVLRSNRATEDVDECIGSKRTRRPNLSKDETGKTTKRPVRGRKLKADDEVVMGLAERKPTNKRKAEENKKPSRPVKTCGVKRSQRIKEEIKRSGKTSQAKTKAEPKETTETKTRKRKATAEDTASPPPKLRRRRTTETSRKATSRSKSTIVSTEKTSARTPRKASGRVRDETSKTTSKIQSKTSKTNAGRTVKVQSKGSHSSTKKIISDSEEKSSPIKTRSARGESAPRVKRANTREAVVENKISKTAAGRKKLTPAVKRSTRRK